MHTSSLPAGHQGITVASSVYITTFLHIVGYSADVWNYSVLIMLWSPRRGKGLQTSCSGVFLGMRVTF